MSLDAPRTNKYEEPLSNATVVDMRQRVLELAPSLESFQYLSKQDRINVRNNYDQLKRILDTADDDVLQKSEYALAKALLKSITQITEKQTPVALRIVPRAESADVSDVVDGEAVDFSDPAEIERYDQELLAQTKAVFEKQAFLKEHKSIKGLQALGSLRVVFLHWDRALQQLKEKPENASMAELLNKHYDKIQDLLEVVNQEVADITDSGTETETETETAEEDVVVDAPVPSESAPLAPLVLDETDRVKDFELTNTAEATDLVAATSEDNLVAPEIGSSEVQSVPEKPRTISIAEYYTNHRNNLSSDIEVMLMTLRHDESKNNIKQVLEFTQNNQLKALFEMSHTDPRYVGLYRQIEEVVSGAKAQMGITQTELPPLVLGQEEYLPDAKRFNEVIAALDDCTLDENDEAFVATCIENYNKYKDVVDGSEATNYLRQLEGVLERKRHESVTGTPHSIIENRVEMIATALQTMRTIDPEGATTLAAMAENVKRLLAEVQQNPEKESSLQTTYASLEAMYKDEMSPERQDDDIALVVLAEPDRKAEFLERHRITESHAPKAPLMSPETIGFLYKKAAFETYYQLWARFTPKAKMMFAAAVGAVIATSEANKDQVFHDANVVESTISGIGLGAHWLTEGAVAQVAAAKEKALEDKIDVRPLTPDVVAALNATVPTNNTETPQTSSVSLGSDTLIKIPEVVTTKYSEAPAVLGDVNTADMAPKIDTSEVVPTRSVDQSGIESARIAESAPVLSTVIEVLGGTDKTTLPDRAIETIFDSVDTTGLPKSTTDLIRAKIKTAFFADADALRRSGIKSGNEHDTFPGDKIDYKEPKEAFAEAVAKALDKLKEPHAVVAKEDDTRTSLALETYQNDLQLLPKAEQLPLVSAAVEAYYATDEGRATLNGDDKNALKPGTIVPLNGLASFIAAGVAEKVRTSVESGSASEILVDESPTTVTAETVSVTEASDESGSASEIITQAGEPGEVTSPEEYPGGVMAYSQAYNEMLAVIGIASEVPSMIDSWFTKRTPDNRDLLPMSVGELTKIMMQGPADIMRELNARKISPEAANAVYELVIEARKNGLAPYDIDSTITIDELIQKRVLAAASTNK